MESLAVAVEDSYNLRPRGALAGSPLLRGLLTVLPREVFEKEVLSLLSETDLAMLSRCGRDCREAVVASDLPRAGAPETGGELLEYVEFVRSTNMLSWARTSGCPWDARVCFAVVALCPPAHRLEVLSFAHENSCPWDEDCLLVAVRIHSTDLLRYMRNQGCPYSQSTFWKAIRWREFEQEDLTLLEFLLDDGCPWSITFEECRAAASRGDLTTLVWLRQKGFMWDEKTPVCAAIHGHLDVIRYCSQNSCPMDDETFVYAFLGTRSDISCCRCDDCDNNDKLLLRRDRCMNVLNWLNENGYPNDHIALVFENADGSYTEYF